MKFGENDNDRDQDRHAWRAYAAAVLAGLTVESSKSVCLVPFAAEIADAMLAEERKRR